MTGMHPPWILGRESLTRPARKGDAMTTAQMATYVHDQIDRARAQLNAVSK